MLFLTVVAVALTTSLTAQWHSEPHRAVGHWLRCWGFAAAAVVLSRQPGQTSNAAILAGVAAIATFGEVSFNLISGWAPLGYVLNGLNPAWVVLALLRYPENRLRWWSRAYVALVAVALLAVKLGQLTAESARSAGAPEGAYWPTAVEDAVAAQHWAGVKSGIYLVLGVAFLALYAYRWTRLGLLERRTARPILWAASAATVTYMGRIVQPFLAPRWAEAVSDARLYAPALLSIGFLLSVLRFELAKGTLSWLILELSGPVTLPGVRSALRRALADDSLDIFYWIPDREAFVDAQGKEVDIEPDTLPDQRWVYLARSHDGQRQVAALVLDARLRRQPELVESAIALSRLAIEKVSLQADVQAQLSAVMDARGRLLHSALEQRRQLERDLHDGAQNRLLSLGLQLGALRASSAEPDAVTQIDGLQKELRQALAELRDLAHGLYPPILAQAGLAAAIQSVTDRMPLDVVQDIPTQRWDPDVENAAYMVALEGLNNAVKHAGPCTVWLQASRVADGLCLQIRDNGVGHAALSSTRYLRNLRDRVEAIGGTVTVTSEPGLGTDIRARLPCRPTPASSG